MIIYTSLLNPTEHVLSFFPIIIRPHCSAEELYILNHVCLCKNRSKVHMHLHNAEL